MYTERKVILPILILQTDMKKLEQLIGCGRIKRLIIDNHNVDLRGFDYYNMIMSDDEIREVVLTDLALGC